MEGVVNKVCPKGIHSDKVFKVHKVGKIALLLLFTIHHPLFTFSQDSVRTGKWVSAQVHYGFIMPLYTSSMAILIQGHVPAFELDYFSKSQSGETYQPVYHFPETGVAVFNAWLGNPLQLGNMMGAYPFINFHLNRNTHERLYLRVGMGLGYMPVKYNREDNHKNNVIGSHINGLFDFRLGYHIYFSDKLRLETSLGITHCSNGAFHTPDLGLNIITAGTGLSYCITKPERFKPAQFRDTMKTNAIQNEFIVAGALSEVEPPGGVQYPAYTLSYLAFRRLSPKSKLGLGIDIFYNEANTERLLRDSVILKSKLEDVQLGIKVNYELTIDKLAIPLETGYYLYSKFTGNGSVYNRIGLRYYAGKHFIANLTMLTHFAKADYIEWGIGYKL